MIRYDSVLSTGTHDEKFARLLYQSPCILGEGPVWHAERNSIFWVDIEGRSIFELSWEGRVFKQWNIRHRVSLIIPDSKDQLILALQGGIAAFNLNTHELQWLVDIEKDLPENRCNDGACDILGRLWVGTMDLAFRPGAGSLYRIDQDFSLKRELTQVTISNGLAWSLDNKRAYYVDSPTRTVKSYFFDKDKGSLSFEKIAIQIPEILGTPDGMCIDEEGMLWVAHWGGFAVNRWNPLTGERIYSLQVNAPNVSACTFGGEQLDHLFITTARQQLSKEELQKYPESGSLFLAKLNVRGVQAHRHKLWG
jgi:sugar lactone lactonase YvrE